MIRRKDEYAVERRPVGGGIGDIEFRHKFSVEETLGKCRICAELVIQPGQTIGEHAHINDVEIYYVVSGELVSVDEQKDETSFKQGDMMFTGGGAKHAVRNDSNEPVHMLAIVINN